MDKTRITHRPNFIGGGTKTVLTKRILERRMLSLKEGILFKLHKKRGERYLAFTGDDVLC